jgi:hypothetical protein
MNETDFRLKLTAMLIEWSEVINVNLAYGKWIIRFVNVQDAVEIFTWLTYNYHDETKNCLQQKNSKKSKETNKIKASKKTR